MTSPRLKLSKHLKRDKVELAIRLYNNLVWWDSQKYDLAAAKTEGLPWASLTKMCELMGWEDQVRQRYMVMKLKKALDKCLMIHFRKMYEEGKRLADTFMFLATDIKEIIFGEEEHTQPLTATVDVIPYVRVYGPRMYDDMKLF